MEKVRGTAAAAENLVMWGINNIKPFVLYRKLTEQTVGVVVPLWGTELKA